MARATLSNLASLPYLAPEGIVVAGLLLVIVAGLLRRRPLRVLAAALALATCAAAALATVLTADGVPRGLCGGLVARDPFADFFKLLALAATAIIALLALRSRDAIDYDKDDGDAHEFYALLLAAALGAMLM